MSTVVMNKKDEIIMKLVHYFVTEENYTPIIVNGVKDEIWLENQNGPYRIVRINSNSIFNEEQLNYDNFKIESIVRQIKKKTLSFSVDTLNILLNVNEDLKLEETKHIKPVAIFNNNLDITNEGILEAFPNINEKLLKDTTGVELIINVTKDINAKTEQENKIYERTFMPKKNIFTYIILIICVAVYLISLIEAGFSLDVLRTGFEVPLLRSLGANYGIQESHQIWRLITYMFLHGSLIHILVNMYSLVALGNQIETFFGRWKFFIIYLLSGIAGGMLSAAISPGATSVGASGAIFGLLGAMLYFGFHYRAYFGQAVKMQILPVIAINLAIGFLLPNIDNWCHIGGLVGGFLVTMAVGVNGKSKKSDQINGVVCSLIFFGFLVYLLFFR
jgi:rhomboid protease GluP